MPEVSAYVAPAAPSTLPPTGCATMRVPFADTAWQPVHWAVPRKAWAFPPGEMRSTAPDPPVTAPCPVSFDE